jgi:hypothetical protein
MSEDNSKTFRETPLSEDDRKRIVSVLKKEGFSEEQLNVMSSEKVWKLCLDSLKKTMSNEISELARAFERNPQVASKFDPMIERMNRESKDLVDSLEKEFDKKKGKREGQP